MITDHGMTVPIGSDDFDPEGAIAALATSLEPMVIVPVSSAAAATALAATHDPSLSDPLFVYRSDLDEIQYTTNGTTWRTPSTGPTVRLRRAAGQSIPNNAYTTISWDTELEDTDSMWTAVSPTRVTIQRSGVYALTTSVGVSGGTSGQFVIAIIQGGSANIKSGRLPAGDSVAAQVTWQQRFTAGQYIEVQFFQNSGASRNTITTVEGQPDLQLTWLRP